MQRKRRSQLKDENISSKLLGTDINSINIEKFRDLTNNKKTKVSLNGSLTLPILKLLTNKFSPEIMFSITVPAQGITSLDALAGCDNLIVLNVSQNNITSLQPLTKLKELWMLNAANNAISALDALSGLTKLINVRLQGNSLINTSSLKSLEECSSLQNLYLQNLSMTDNNPICQTPGYRKNVLDLLSGLKRLDGISRNTEMDPGKELVSSKKAIKIELKSQGAFYTAKFPSVITNFQPLQGQPQLKKSLSDCREGIAALQRLFKLALVK